MLAIELQGGLGTRCRPIGVATPRQHTPDDIEHVRGSDRFGQDLVHAKRQRQRPRLALAVMRGVEDDRRLADGRVAAKLPQELEAVHDGHEHIGDHKIRTVGADDRKRFVPIGGLEEPVSMVSQQRGQIGPVRGQIVDDQDRLNAETPSADSVLMPVLHSGTGPERTRDVSRGLRGRVAQAAVAPLYQIAHPQAWPVAAGGAYRRDSRCAFR